jgi:hypothetical protein
MKVGGCLLIAGSVLLGGCATSTPGISPARQTSTAAPASTQTSTQALTPVVTTADNPRITAVNRYAREMGYKIVIRHGVQFYCRRTAPIGSRLEETQCLTAEGMDQAQQIAEENNNSWQESHQCLGAGCVIK